MQEGRRHLLPQPRGAAQGRRVPVPTASCARDLLSRAFSACHSLPALQSQDQQAAFHQRGDSAVPTGTFPAAPRLFANLKALPSHPDLWLPVW